MYQYIQTKGVDYVNDKPSEDDVLNGRIFLGGLLVE